MPKHANKKRRKGRSTIGKQEEPWLVYRARMKHLHRLSHASDTDMTAKAGATWSKGADGGF